LVNLADLAFNLGLNPRTAWARREFRGGPVLLGEVLPRLVARRVQPLTHLAVTVRLPHGCLRAEAASAVAALASLTSGMQALGTRTRIRVGAGSQHELRWPDEQTAAWTRTLREAGAEAVVFEVLSSDENDVLLGDA